METEMHLSISHQDLLFDGGEGRRMVGHPSVEVLTESNYQHFPPNEDLFLDESQKNIMDAFHQNEIFQMAGFNYSQLGNLSDIERLLNMTKHLDISVMQKFQNNIRVSHTGLIALLIAYSIFIVLGTVGNCLVIIAVARNRALRTPRNMFLMNLTVSDLLLCLLTMPLTLLEIVTQHWPLGSAACKAVGTLQGTTVFASTLSIVAIALDRNMESLLALLIPFLFLVNVIVQPADSAVGKRGAILGVAIIWILAISCALPNYFMRKLETHQLDLPGLEEVSFCFEDWPVDEGRAYYSCFVLVSQFFAPIVIVSAAYCEISHMLKRRGRRSIRLRSKNSLRSRPVDQNSLEMSATTDSSSQLKTIGCSKIRRSLNDEEEGDQKFQKINQLLTAITIVFCISWLPFNLYNLTLDLFYVNENITEGQLILYAVCHLCGMSSACTNPFLYGWLNQNFRHEFAEMFSRCLCKRSVRRPWRSGKSHSMSCNFTEMVVRKGSNDQDNVPPVSVISHSVVTLANATSDTAFEMNGVFDDMKPSEVYQAIDEESLSL